MTTPRPDAEKETTAKGLTDTGGSEATEDESVADPGLKGLDAGTLPGETTSDRATGLTAPG